MLVFFNIDASGFFYCETRQLMEGLFQWICGFAHAILFPSAEEGVSGTGSTAKDSALTIRPAIKMKTSTRSASFTSME
jgi:hypothetical protein